MYADVINSYVNSLVQRITVFELAPMSCTDYSLGYPTILRSNIVVFFFSLEATVLSRSIAPENEDVRIHKYSYDVGK